MIHLGTRIFRYAVPHTLLEKDKVQGMAALSGYTMYTFNGVVYSTSDGAKLFDFEILTKP